MSSDACDKLAQKLSKLTLQQDVHDAGKKKLCENFAEALIIGPRNSKLCEDARNVESRKPCKSVSFADNRGGALVEVREFSGACDFATDFSKQPATSISKLRQQSKQSDQRTDKFYLLFVQPCMNYTNFMMQLWRQNICLESAEISNYTAKGTIKAINISCQKQVHIKLTHDSWATFNYVLAPYSHSEDPHVDIFTYDFFIPPDTAWLKFCIRYRCDGKEYWDNNRGYDYSIAARL